MKRLPQVLKLLWFFASMMIVRMLANAAWGWFLLAAANALTAGYFVLTDSKLRNGKEKI
jgi:hypothetical protein